MPFTWAIRRAAARSRTNRYGTARPRRQGGLINAVPPLMVKTPANPGGLPKQVFDGYAGPACCQPLQFLSLARRADRSMGSTDRAPRPPKAIIQNWWRQGMMGGAKAHYDGIVAFSQTDFTEDLKKIYRARAGDARRRRPDRPLCGFGPLSAKLVKNGTLKGSPERRSADNER